MVESETPLCATSNKNMQISKRTRGDYDSWFIKRASDGLYLRGFQYWDEVDGALIRYFITKHSALAGQVDLGFRRK